MLTIENLEICFKTALEHGFTYVGVCIRMEGFNHDEIIINPLGNVEEKLEYYKNTYNKDLTHKYAGNKIQIVGFTFADTFKEIEEDFYVYDTFMKDVGDINDGEVS